MARKKRTPEENARREKIRELLQMANIGSMDDIQSLFKETIAEFMENGLDAELDDELGYSRYDYKNKDTDNSRNGHSSKTLRTSFGDVEISVPRDRKGEFEPHVLKKNQTSISQDIEEKILSMYAKGMTTSDIETHIQEIYGVEVSDTTVSRITDKILPIAKEWQQRPLESVYAVVFMDAIHYHVRSEGQIVKKAVYIAIGIDLDGRKDVLGMWVGENESAKYWATVLNSLKNRGIEDIFIACTDNLTGFSTAIEAVFPKTEIQNCIIHQLRNSSKYVSYKDIKALMADLKAVYAAVDEAAALDALDTFSERWDKKYPKIAPSWRENWSNLEHNSRTVGGVLCRPHAGLTGCNRNVKSRDERRLTPPPLTSPRSAVIFVEKAAAACAAPALKYFCSILHHNLAFTQNLGLTPFFIRG